MNNSEYCLETAKSSLKASMKSDIISATILNVRDDYQFLREVKERCVELTGLLSARNLLLFKNKSILKYTKN